MAGTGCRLLRPEEQTKLEGEMRLLAKKCNSSCRSPSTTKCKDIGGMGIGDVHKILVKKFWPLGVRGVRYPAGSVNSYVDGYVLKYVVKYIVIPCYL